MMAHTKFQGAIMIPELVHGTWYKNTMLEPKCKPCTAFANKGLQCACIKRESKKEKEGAQTAWVLWNRIWTFM